MAQTREILVAVTSVLVQKLLVDIEERQNEDDYISESAEVLLIEKLYRDQEIEIKRSSERIVELYSDADFQEHFRLKRSSFVKLLNFLHLKSSKKDADGNTCVPLEKQLQVTLWILGNQEDYQSAADRFGVSVSSAWQSVFQISQLLVDNRKNFIQWPKADNARNEIRKFKQICGFPGVVGAIDVSYIPISAPSEHADLYICRKKFHAINMQAVCTTNLKFISVDIGSPGSMYNARVLRRSHLFKMIRQQKDILFPSRSHMVGDLSYPVSEILMVPFKNTLDLTTAEENFNKKLASTRIVIERAFSLLKTRFRRLKYVDIYRTDMVPLIVLACVILHNMCIDYRDECDEASTENAEEPLCLPPNDEDSFDNAINGKAKRNFIMNYLRTNS